MSSWLKPERGGRLGWWEVVQVEREGSGFELETGGAGGCGQHISDQLQQSHNTRRPYSVSRLRGHT